MLSAIGVLDLGAPDRARSSPTPGRLDPGDEPKQVDVVGEVHDQHPPTGPSWLARQSDARVPRIRRASMRAACPRGRHRAPRAGRPALRPGRARAPPGPSGGSETGSRPRTRCPPARRRPPASSAAARSWASGFSTTTLQARLRRADDERRVQVMRDGQEHGVGALGVERLLEIGGDRATERGRHGLRERRVGVMANAHARPRSRPRSRARSDSRCRHSR